MPDIERMAVIGYLKVLAHLTSSKYGIPACRGPHASVGTFKEPVPTPFEMPAGASVGALSQGSL
jgi:hypothetical protein